MVDFKEASSFAEQHGLKYVETSAKEGAGVEEAFLTLAKECLEVMYVLLPLRSLTL